MVYRLDFNTTNKIALDKVVFTVTSILNIYKGFILKNDLFGKGYYDFCKAAVEDNAPGLPAVHTKNLLVNFAYLRF